MIIIGIDPGIARMGWGIININKQEVHVIDMGIIETNQDEQETNRLKIIYQKLNHLLKNYKPDAVSVEAIYHNSNSKTVIQVSQARGVILLAAALQNIPVYSYSPPNVKKIVTGNGFADKKQIEKMIKIILKLDNNSLLDDTYDALAIALTHAYQLPKGVN